MVKVYMVDVRNEGTYVYLKYKITYVEKVRSQRKNLQFIKCWKLMYDFLFFGEVISGLFLEGVLSFCIASYARKTLKFRTLQICHLCSILIYFYLLCLEIFNYISGKYFCLMNSTKFLVGCGVVD